MRRTELVMGAVAYDPKVVTIWDGFRDWLRARDLDFDYVLYTNYEAQVEALVAGAIGVAWNSPLAFVRASRLAGAAGMAVDAVAMRDTDCDLTSVIVVRAGSGIEGVPGLAGRTVAVGAADSPQATLIPLGHLAASGLAPGRDFTVLGHEVGVGKHGDHIGGERDALLALLDGRADAACLVDANHLAFSRDGTLPAGATRVLAQTGPYDHCNFTVVTGGPPPGLPPGPPPGPPPGVVERFRDLLLSMSYADPRVRPLLDLEGLRAWWPGRTTGYGLLEQAVVSGGFYDYAGNVTAAGYQP